MVSPDFDWRTACLDAERRYIESQRDRDRWKELALYLCQNTICVIPDELAAKFPDINNIPIPK